MLAAMPAGNAGVETPSQLLAVLVKLDNMQQGFKTAWSQHVHDMNSIDLMTLLARGLVPVLPAQPIVSVDF